MLQGVVLCKRVHEYLDKSFQQGSGVTGESSANISMDPFGDPNERTFWTWITWTIVPVQVCDCSRVL